MIARPFLAATLAALVATPVVGLVAVRWRLVAPPNPIVADRRHEVPYLGGVALLVGAVVGLLATGSPLPGGLVLGGALFALLGLADDVAPLAPAPKLAAQATVAAAAVIGGDLTRPLTGLPALDAAIAILWIVTAVNAVNFIDVCDGLAAVVGLVVALGWAVVASAASSASAMAAIAGACTGFLVWNRPPARIYMGDSGSHLLGFAAAAAALTGLPDAPAGAWLAAAPLTLGVPLFELAFISWIRVRKGISWWRGSPDHFALRLQAAGLRKSTIGLVSAGAAAALWLAAVGVLRLADADRVTSSVLLTGAVVVMMVACARILARYEVTR